MLGRYYRTFVKLAGLVNDLEAWSDDAASVCLAIQLELIQRIKHVEKQIRRWKSVEPQTDVARARAASYQRVNRTLRLFADAIAFTYMSRWDIKAFSRANAAGFISGKEGFSLEKRVLTEVAQEGARLLLADLTNCLRYGDAYCFAPNRLPLIMEMKSSKVRKSSGRNQRQKKRLDSLIEYLQTGHGFVKGEETRRVSLSSEIVDYGDVMSDVATEAYARGGAARRLSESLGYFALCGPDAEVVRDATAGMSRPMWFPVTAGGYLVESYPYYPITLVLKDAEALARFLVDRMVLGVAIDYAHIEERAQSRGATVRQTGNDDEWMLDVTLPNSARVKVSRALFGRIIFEFWDLDYFIDSIILDNTAAMDMIAREAAESTTRVFGEQN